MIKNIFCRFLNRINFFKNRTVYISRKFYDVQWRIPIINGLGYEYSFANNSEIWVYNFLKNVNAKKQISLFIDVGSNIGQTLIKIKSIQPNVDYIGFDPSIKCVSYVQQLQQLNHLKNTSILAVGISDTIGTLTLRGYSDTDTRASFSDAQVSEEQATFASIVPVFNLDYLVKQNEKDKLTILKIDVEGHELSVLKGANELIQTAKPIILFEVLPHHDNKVKIQNAKELYSFLTKNAYTVYHLDQLTFLLKEVTDLSANENNYNETDFIAFDSHVNKDLTAI